MNDPFTYISRITLPVAGEVTKTLRMIHPFYLYDLVGVPSVSVGVDLKLQIEDVSEARRFSSEGVRSGLVAVDVPGKSSWLHPVEISKGNVLQIRAVLRAGAAGVDFDLGLRGCHHLGLVAGDCPSPQKGLFFYVWDFGDSLAVGSETTKTVKVLAQKDFIGLGWQATPSCAVVDSLSFMIENQSTGRQWSNLPQMGSSLFGDLSSNVRRKPFPEPIRFDGGEVVTVVCANTTAAPVLDAAICMYGFHVSKGEEL
jgi:hypothetical protein